MMVSLASWKPIALILEGLPGRKSVPESKSSNQALALVGGYLWWDHLPNLVLWGRKD